MGLLDCPPEGPGDLSGSTGLSRWELSGRGRGCGKKIMPLLLGLALEVVGKGNGLIAGGRVGRDGK
jgi:hypothetical protein